MSSTDSDSTESFEKTYEQLLRENKKLKKKLKRKGTSETIDGKMHIGEGYTIKKEAYERAFHKQDPSTFVTTFAYGMFGYELLSQSTIDGKNRPALDKKGIMVLTRYFDKFLLKKGYPPALRAREIEKCNKYLGSAITGGIRHLATVRKNKNND